MAFRLHDEKPQYRLANGELCAGGSLTFSISGGSTAKSVYQEPALSTDLGSTITLDSDARHSEDLWLDDSVTAYRVVLKDSDGATVWTLDNVRSTDIAVAAVLPDAADADDGQALFSDGTSGGWYWDDVLTIPSMTGNSGKYLTNDGVILSWASFTDDVATEVEATAGASGSYVIGDVRVQWGTDTAPTAGALSTTKAVTFGVAFSGTPYHISVEPVLSSGVTNNSPSDFPSTRYSSPSTTGFTAGFFCGAENNGGTLTITSTIPFTWQAIGPA